MVPQLSTGADPEIASSIFGAGTPRFRKESPLLAPRPPGRGGPPRKRHPPGARPDAAGDRVVRIDDREIVLALVREDAFLRRRVLLDARVAVEMIGRDVRQ